METMSWQTCKAEPLFLPLRLLGAEVALPGDLEPGAVGLISLPLLDVVGELVSGGEAAEVGEDVGVADGHGDLEGDAGGLVAPEIELGAVGGEVADVVGLLNPIPELGHLAGQGLGVAVGGLVMTSVDDLESLTLVEPLELVDVEVLSATESVGLKGLAVGLRDVVPALAEEEGAVVLDLDEALGLESLRELGPGLLGSSASDSESEDDAEEEGTHGCVSASLPMSYAFLFFF